MKDKNSKATAGALGRLEALVGEWELTVDLPHPSGQGDDSAGCTFGWLKGRNLLIQRTHVPDTDVPDSICVIGPAPDIPGRFLQHYFDSRGVIRLYAMLFAGRELELLRDKADFSPLDFYQRYRGTM